VFKILHIETATDICSVALSEDDKLVDYISLHEKNIHSSKLTLFIDELLEKTANSYSNLDAVSVSKGPGSFTGLRIGVSVAKGICYGIEKPLIAVNTLRSLITALKREQELKDEHICTLIDARNNEVYYAIYDANYRAVLEPEVGKLEPEKMREFLSNRKMIFIGDGVEKWAESFNNNDNCMLLSTVLPDARNLIPLAVEKYKNKDFEDLNYFEPYYLRDFKAKKVSLKIKKILNID
jgi:tRNA threonylcarbamoyladenosine biosynthesis protein TsaB